MDLLGYGATEEEALRELRNAIACQITFARQKKDDGLLLFPAEREYYHRWEAANAMALKKEVLQDKSTKLAARAVVITFSKQELQDPIKRSFRQILNRSCAEAT
jgi:hypothetical protein